MKCTKIEQKYESLANLQPVTELNKLAYIKLGRPKTVRAGRYSGIRILLTRKRKGRDNVTITNSLHVLCAACILDQLRLYAVYTFIIRISSDTIISSIISFCEGIVGGYVFSLFTTFHGQIQSFGIASKTRIRILKSWSF